MIRISTYRDKTREGSSVRVQEVSSATALDELILALSAKGFVEEDVLVHAKGNSKADVLRIAVTTHLPGPMFVVFEGLLETEMYGLGVVSEWFVKATKSASEEVLRKILS
jgi:hypothetical protein